MTIKIKLVEDQILVINADPEAWANAYTRALETNSVIEVHNAQGGTLAVNPHQILFWEVVPEGEEPDRAPQAPQAQPA